MKHNKAMDFFDSPCPRSFDPNHMRDDRIHHTDDLNINGDRLFSTPVPPFSYHLTSPRQTKFDHYFTYPRKHQLIQINHEDQMSEEGSHRDYESEEDYESPPEINEKLMYSEEEELLIHITPEKPQILEQNNELATVRKKAYQQSTPQNQNRYSERGLKKLASLAFTFVSQLKKTTYKDVAKKLIDQLVEDNEIELQKKGQMNIKRRVYDALNVLIALGILKRNGNKIEGKKAQNEASSNYAAQKGKQNTFKVRLHKKQDLLQEELSSLKSLMEEKMSIIKKKQNALNAIKEKYQCFKKLTLRNKSQTALEMVNQEKDATFDKKTQKINIFKFPLVFMMSKDNQQPIKSEIEHLKIQKKQVFPGINLQQEKSQFKYSFPKHIPLALMSDLDGIQYLFKANEQHLHNFKKEAEIIDKSRKIKRRRVRQ